MTGRRLWRRRQRDPRPLEALLGDPDTVGAAQIAFAAAGRDDAPWWPCAAAVGPDTVTVRLVGLEVPEPAAPWRAGHEPHVWTANRGELAEAVPAGTRRPVRGRLLVIGRHRDSVVFVDITRSAGAIEVTGDPAQAERVHQLIAGQLRALEADTRTRGGAYWPVEVYDDVIVLIGLPVATVLSEADSRLAYDLMLRTAVVTEPVRPADPAPAPSATPDDGAGPGTLADGLGRPGIEIPANAPPAPRGPEPEPQPTPQPTPPVGSAGAPTRAQDPEDWQDDEFAVSSADEQTHR
jgi:hypothetical protein